MITGNIFDESFMFDIQIIDGNLVLLDQVLYLSLIPGYLRIVGTL